MTDFVAVIRRAVDGLKDNNPEMRAKVYEKARAAVLKQLENMKPQPSADVVARQMAKLDAAVLSVENEHADAVPAEMPVAEQPVYAPEPEETEWQAPPAPVAASQPAFEAPVAPAPQPAPFQPQVVEAPAHQASAPAQQTDLLWMPDDEEEEPAPVAAPAPRVAAPATPKIQSPAPVAAPLAADIPWDESPFDEDHVAPPPPRQAAKPAPVAARPAPVAEDRGSFSEIEDLPGFEIPAPTASRTKGKRTESADVERIVSKLEGKSFRAQPKAPKISLAGIAAGLAGLVIVGVGGYGAWAYRDTIMSIVDGSSTQPALDAASLDKPKTVETSAPAQPAADATKQTQVAAATPKDIAGSGKFTQRLLPDGSETNEALTNLPKTDGKEGKSVAQQTVKSKDVAAATPSATPAASDTAAPAADATAPATTDATAAPAGQTADASAAPDPNATTGVTQKMFLYEERLGQASPTAITGTVVWSVANDTTTTGKPQSEIQAKVTVPDRGLSALITFRRNADKSLPASHLIELAFSLPKDFDGGNIESVQRIALKQTEQDRGNSLIAVPTKVTDDFHMIALNDDPDALASNTDLLKSRNWIDIPITYRNGRRALITIEKGTTGNEDFNKVMAEWAAMGPA